MTCYPIRILCGNGYPRIAICLLRRFLGSENVKAVQAELLIKMERNGVVNGDYFQREKIDQKIKQEDEAVWNLYIRR